MGNVTLPTPVFLSGGALCLVAGYLLGAVASPGTPARTTAQVLSFDSGNDHLCLRGDGVNGQEGADQDGVLCGTWRRTPASATPTRGESFRFVSIKSVGTFRGTSRSEVVIYGDVTR